MAKSIAILQSNYIPWKGYFDLINSVDEFIVHDCWQYTRGDWRNRNKIKAPSGPVWLTIPVKSKNHIAGKLLINQVETMDNKWRQSHWKSLLYNYARAPEFKRYGELLEALYLGDDLKEERNLSRINLTFIENLAKMLGITTPIISVETEQKKLDKNQRLIDICKARGADIYLSGPAAQNYIDCQKFQEQGIQVLWMDYSDYPEYRQLQTPFEHSVSVVDLILNEGSRAPSYMKSFTPGWKESLRRKT